MTVLQVLLQTKENNNIQFLKPLGWNGSSGFGAETLPCVEVMLWSEQKVVPSHQVSHHSYANNLYQYLLFLKKKNVYQGQKL